MVIHDLNLAQGYREEQHQGLVCNFILLVYCFLYELLYSSPPGFT